MPSSSDRSSSIAPPLGAPRFGYPVVLDLHGVAVLVVGGGRIAARKAHDLAGAGARVKVVAIDVSSHVDRDLVAEVHERAFVVTDLDDVRLCVTATGDADVDHDVARAATQLGIWVNAADQTADCSFILPAIARSGRVSVAVSSDGASPALAKRVRDQAGGLLDDRVGEAAEALAAERAVIRSAGGSTEEVDWSGRLDELLG